MNGKPSSLSCVWQRQMSQNPPPAAKSFTCFHELIEPTIGRATHTRSYKGLSRRKYIAHPPKHTHSLDQEISPAFQPKQQQPRQELNRTGGPPGRAR